MFKQLTTLVVASAVFVSLSGCVVSIGNHNAAGGNDASATFGNVTVDSGNVAGNLQATNGNVEIGQQAKVKNVEVTNGNIEIDNASTATSLQTVNGNIEGGKQVVVIGDVSTVNGNIQFKASSELGGNVETVNGDIVMAANTAIAGDIVFSTSSGWSGISGRTPKLQLSEGVTVGGKIHLHRKVHLILPGSIDPDQIIRHYLDE